MMAAKKIWNAVSTVLVVIAVALAIALAGVRLVGLRVYSVLSGSMEPNYHTGSLIYVKKVDTSQLKAGDVITFMLDEDTVGTMRPCCGSARRATPTTAPMRGWYIVKT